MSQLIPAITGLAPIAAGVGLLALFGRDPKADEHDLSDYHEPAPVAPSFSFMLAERGLAQMRADLAADDILPPAPPGTNAGGSPIHAALVAEQVIAEQLRKWGATPAERAARILRELGDKAQMEATR